ncbi:MAG: hypothetical protein ACF8PN_07955 [Phycisphaerales bacterium]
MLYLHARHARRTTNRATGDHAGVNAPAAAAARVRTIGVASLSLVVVALALTGATPEVASGAGDPRVWTVDTKANGRHVAKKVDDPDNFTGRIYTAKSEANERALILNRTDDAGASASDASTAVGSIALSVNRADTAVDSMETVQLGDDQLALSQKIANLSSQIVDKAQLAAEALSWSQTYYSDAQVAEQEAADAAAAARAAADAHAADPTSIDPDEVKALEKEAKAAAKSARVLDKKSNKQANKSEKHADKRARLITKLDDLLAEYGESRNGGNGNGNGGGGDDFIVLQPGTGFGGPTGQPGPVGSPDDPGYDAKAIARWDVVPYQTFDDDFHIGVVAFHMNGIDRVEFSVEGGPWTAVTDMQLNPRTNVWEYTAVLDPDLFEDGPLEVRAIAWPVIGEPRVLGGEINGASVDLGEHSLVLSSNAGTSLPAEVRYVAVNGDDDTGDGSRQAPFATIMKAANSIAESHEDIADGGTIYLLPGDYELGPYSFGLRATTESRWLTISAAPDVPRHQVRVTGSSTSDGLRTRLVAVKRVSVSPSVGTTALLAARSPEAMLWMDDVELIGPGRIADSSWTNGWDGGVFATRVHIRDARDGLKNIAFQREVSIANIGSDAFGSSRLVINCAVDGIDKSGSDYHPDVYQFYGPDTTFRNHIVYGLTAMNAKSQGIFARGIAGIEDTAFINVLIECSDPVMLSQWRSPVSDHVLFWHVSILNKPFWWRTDDGWDTPIQRNISFFASCFESLLTDYSIVLADYESCHFITGDYPSSQTATSGNPHFVNAASDDYRPDNASPLFGRIRSLRVPLYDGVGLISPGHVGAIQRVD